MGFCVMFGFRFGVVLRFDVFWFVDLFMVGY